MPKPNNDPEMFDLTISDGLSLRDSPESQPAMCVAKADSLGDQNLEVTADDSVSQLSDQTSVGVMLLQAELAMARAKQRERQADTELAELEFRIEQAKQNSSKNSRASWRSRTSRGHHSSPQVITPELTPDAMKETFLPGAISGQNNCI